MTGRAHADRSIRRLAVVPEPYEDESFGSWLARLAGAHHATREDFVRALLLSISYDQKHPVDLDADPPPGLIAELSRRTGWERARLELQRVPPAHRLPALKTTSRESYCPACWLEDREADRRYIRRYWRERWGVMCEIHEIPLRISKLSADELICGKMKPDWVDGYSPDAFSPKLSKQVTRAQREVRAFERGSMNLPDERERARVLRDLALLAGTQFLPSDSLISWACGHERGFPRRLYWQDGRDPDVTDSASSEPSGTLQVRQHAMRISTILMLKMEEGSSFARHDDVAIYALLTFIGPGTSLAWAVIRLRREWPEIYKKRWSDAFNWPDGRDPVIWARSQGSAVAPLETLLQ